jgi:zinc/manganese transport system ATP-binding protein
VLLCDEPLLSLDADSQREVTALIHRLRTEVATAVVFVTHEVEVVQPFADRILHLHHHPR